MVNTIPALPLAGAVGRISSSAIRDLLVHAERPGVISLAGGLPAPETFPAAELAEAAIDVLGTDAARALQYSSSQGLESLREWIAAERGCGATAADVVVTAGSQQALDLLARTLLDPGDVVALADPGYVGAIQAFRLAGAELLPIPADEHGLRVDLLSDRLRGGGPVPRAVYVVSNFANPGGATLSDERRDALADLADRFGFVVIDDDPYGALRWAGVPARPLAGRSDRVVTVGTFSKVLSPGLRIGYAIGSPRVIEAMVLLKQAADLHAATLNQHIVERVVTRPGFLAPHVERSRRCYEARATALVSALDRHLGDRCSFAAPEGGMFVWVRLAGVDAAAALDRAVDAGVAYVPGAAFAVAPGAHRDSLRLSFATVEPDALDEGVRRLASVLVPAAPTPG